MLSLVSLDDRIVPSVTAPAVGENSVLVSSGSPSGIATQSGPVASGTTIATVTFNQANIDKKTELIDRIEHLDIQIELKT